MKLVRWVGVVAGMAACGYGCGASIQGGAAVGDDASTAAPGTDPGFGSLFPPVADGGSSVPGVPDSRPMGHGVVTIDDAAAALVPAAAYSVTLTMDTFTVLPGGEVYKCQDFANPFQGQPVDIVRYELAMNQGSHHMLLLYTPNATDGPAVDCPQGGLQIGPFTFGAQSLKATQEYPAGIGAAIPAGMGFTVDSHYINSGSSPIQGAVKITMFVARPGLVTQHAGVLQFILTSFSIPPTGQPYTITGSCPVGQDMSLLWANAHMHRRATHFVAASGGTTLYQTDAWSDSPAAAFSPPLQLKANANITWACTYINDTSGPLTFGESALTNAMCNFGSTFYPVQDPSNPVTRCLQ
jgi:hypothetical protein